jgi:hypothetical protein
MSDENPMKKQISGFLQAVSYLKGESFVGLALVVRCFDSFHVQCHLLP